MSGPRDNVDAAIAAVAAQPVPVEMVHVPMTLGTGRPYAVDLPRDVTDMEALQAVQGLLLAVDKVRQLAPASRLVVPGRTA